MGFDPDAEDYIRRIFAAGSFVLPHVQIAVERFVVGCKADASPNEGVSNWDALKACCLMAGPAMLEAALVPLKGPVPSNFNFTQDDYHQVLGLKGNGYDKWLWSGLTVSDMVGDNCSLGFFTTESEGTDNLEALGGRTSGGSTRFSIRSQSATVKALEIGGGNNQSVPETKAGFSGASRWVTGGIGRYGGNSYPLGVPGSMVTNDDQLRVFRTHTGGLGTQFTTARIAWYHYGEAVDLESLDRRVSRYMRDIATPARRGFPMSRLVN